MTASATMRPAYRCRREYRSRRESRLGVRIEYDHEVSDLSRLPEADLIAAADGVNSRIRREVGTFSTNEVAGANRYIWLGTTKVFEEFNYLFVPTPSGWIWAHAYGIDATTSTFIPECTAETWPG
jgi:2-polyprenyl-6-methoxyphenol hydroxylase-like FAD-dependent oxidoreductase